MKQKKAIVLLSGGMDSATVLHLVKSQGFEVYTLAFDYGQRHRKELVCAKLLADNVEVAKHVVAKLSLDLWKGSALTDQNLNVPLASSENSETPITYVPARNMVFLSLAASYAETIGAHDIFIGISQIDYSGYVDCRPEFLEAMEATVNKGTDCAVKGGNPIRLHAPFMNKSKVEELREGLALGVDYGLTWTCYVGDDMSCGKCDSCQLRRKAFEEIGEVDPLPYAS